MKKWRDLGWWDPNGKGESESDRMFDLIGMENVLPEPPDWYNAFGYTPFEKVRAVILGQDPYPTPGHAHGLAFSVQTPVSVLPRSLKNIFIELEKDIHVPFPTTGNLTPWAEQGVLLLNSILTVTPGRPLSHANRGWERLSKQAIHALVRHRQNIVFVLWGGKAREVFEESIILRPELVEENDHMIVTSAHPSPRSAHLGFFGSRPFSKVNQLLREKNVSPIDWRLA